MTLYHAASPSYQRGDDLLSLGRLLDSGRIDAAELAGLLARWTEAGDDYLFGDGQLVSFTESREEAEAIRAAFNGNAGLLIAVESDELKEWGFLTRNAEGYPAARGGKVPAEILTIID